MFNSIKIVHFCVKFFSRNTKMAILGINVRVTVEIKIQIEDPVKQC